MKLNQVFAVMVIGLSSFSSAFAAQESGCSKNASKALDFAVADMAIQKSDAFPFGLFGEDGNVVTIEQVCAHLVSSAMAPSSEREGYSDLTMDFDDGTSCLISLQVMADGKVGDFTPFSCHK